MVQILITSAFVAMFTLSESLRMWIQVNPGILIASMFLSIALVVVLAFSENARRQFPANFILLFAFTFVEGFLVGVISSAYEANSVLLAAGITVAICLSLTMFAFQTKIDFTGIGPYLFMALMALTLFSFSAMLFSSVVPIENVTYCCLGALLFSFYLIYDTQLIIGGNHKQSISPEEYLFAALTLYLDIINIFIKILAAVGKRRN